MTVRIMCFVLMVPWVALKCVIVAFTGHAHLFIFVQQCIYFERKIAIRKSSSGRSRGVQGVLLNPLPAPVLNIL